MDTLPTQLCTPVLRLPFPLKSVNHIHRISRFPRCPCKVPKSHFHPSTSVECPYWRSEPTCCSQRTPIATGETTTRPWQKILQPQNPSGTPEQTCPQDMAAGGTKEVPLQPLPKIHINAKPLASRMGDAVNYPGANLVPHLGKEQGMFRPDVSLRQVQPEIMDEQRPQHHGPLLPQLEGLGCAFQPCNTGPGNSGLEG